MCASCKDVPKEEQEVFLVVDADTVIDPRAVMVHSCDTPVACSTVMGTGWLYTFTLLAVVQQ